MTERNMFITLLSSFTIFIFISLEIPIISIATTNETDFQALLDIKINIHSDISQALNSWNDSIHLCNWHGIICEKRYNRVTVLNLSSLNLVGTLSPYIGNLTFLKEIYLDGNFFTGIIRPEIGRLFRLRNLVLANNSFYGHIPINLRLATNLQIINLVGNKLSGRIPDELGALCGLKELHLAKNNFSGYIPSSLGNISTLQIIYLSYNHLGGNIPYELGKLFNLQVLRLGENNLSGHVPIEIYNVSSIINFSIPKNNLVGHFPDTLGLTLPNLMQFLVTMNNFSGSIPSTLANASYLEEVEIGDNKLTGPIPRNLGRLQQLQWLLLDGNPLGIDKDNDISFITTLTNCTNLMKLSLSEIEMGGILRSEYFNLSRNLTLLMLNDNHISGNLPETIGELFLLNYFDVSGNNLSGNIPHSISKLINMMHISLSDNKFIGQIPPNIGNISRLLFLNLSHNMLTGSIPISMSNFTEMQLLDLSVNHLNGSLLKEVFSITSLSIGLYLSQNNFTGSLPLEVGNMINLVWLSVSGNELSGEIPISIGGCQMLEHLDMKDNFLEGTIPSTLGHLTSIEFMDLSGNKLSGKIPISMEKLIFLNFLNLSFNMLRGEVPKDGVFLNKSAFSIVGNDQLCGGVKLLNLPICPSPDSKKHIKLAAYIIIILVFDILSTISFVLLYRCVYEICKRRKPKEVPYLISTYGKQLPRFSYAEILTSTNGFSSENLIGDGKYGSIYRGVLKTYEKVVAIKVLKLQLKGSHKSFLAECEVLKNIRHKNLLQIITSCSSIDFKGNNFNALILEFVSNGSLEEWLHQNQFVHANKKKLNFLERLNIAIDIAVALDYLHNHSGNPIVHCDIKPSNILLGDDLRGLVSDFGLAKFLLDANDYDIESISIGIRGTIGYIAPEYGMGSDVSTKGDIYSYGILLLEMFTGKRPTDTMFTVDFSLHNYVKTALYDRVADVIDPRLFTFEDNEDNISSYTSTKIEYFCLSVFCVGVSCSSVMQKDRMDIGDALVALQHVRNEM